MAALTPLNAVSPLDASDNTYHSFTVDITETTSFALDDVDTDFLSMDTASWTIEYRQQNRADDTVGLSLRVMSGAIVLAADDSGGTFVTVNSNVTNTTDTTDGPTSFAYVNTGATETDWNNATVEIQQTYSKTKGNDGVRIDVDMFELTGTYSQAVIYNVEVDNTSHLHTATSPTTTIVNNVEVDSATHLHTSTSPALSQIHDIVSQSTAHLHTASSPSLTQNHDLGVQSAVHLHTASSPTIAVISIVQPDNAVHLHTAQSPSINQVHKVLRIRPDGTAESANFTEDSIAGKLMILDKDSGVTVHGELIEDAAFVLDGDNEQVIAFEFIEV